MRLLEWLRMILREARWFAVFGVLYWVSCAGVLVNEYGTGGQLGGSHRDVPSLFAEWSEPNACRIVRQWVVKARFPDVAKLRERHEVVRESLYAQHGVELNRATDALEFDRIEPLIERHLNELAKMSERHDEELATHCKP